MIYNYANFCLRALSYYINNEGFENMIYDLQKASFLKRISAFLLDFILMVILVTGFMWLLSMATNYDQYSETLSAKKEEIQISYGIPAIEEQYEVTVEKYASMTESERNSLPIEIQSTIENCIEDINSNHEILNAYSMVANLMLLMISLSLFFSHFILEFLIPLFFKNGQTVGKKIFSIAVMRVDGVKITSLILFIRSILGKYTVEVMIPVTILLMMFFGSGNLITLGVLFLILVFQLILLIFTRTNSTIHDILSSTVVVDLQSQMIFESLEAKEEYQLRIHNEEAQNAKYF